MAVTAGDLGQITYNYPGIGTGTFNPVSGESATVTLGGYINSSAKVDAGSRLLQSKEQEPWMVECVVSNDTNTTEDIVRLKALQESLVEGTFTFTLADGTVWKGTGIIVETVGGDVKEGTMPFKATGGGKLQKIA